MKKSKRKTNLKSSILLLLLVAILLIASSYAWFTSNQTVTVSSLDVNVQAQNGLQISVDGTNWKSVIQKADLTGATTTYASNVNQLPTELEAVSAIGDIDTTTGFMNMYYGVVTANDAGEYILSATKETEKAGLTGKFISFDLFFKVDTDTPVYLSTNSNVICTDGKADKGLQNAARVAFAVQGNTATGSSLATIQGLKGATPATTYIWEPNYDVHTAAGVANAFDTYGITTTTTGGTSIPYDGIKAPIAPDTGVLLGQANATTHADLFAPVTPNYKTINGFTTNQPVFTLSAGITKIRMYMWVEGQDVDCENNASGSDISFNVQMTSLDA